MRNPNPLPILILALTALPCGTTRAQDAAPGPAEPPAPVQAPSAGTATTPKTPSSAAPAEASPVQGPLTLDEAIRIALANQYQIAIAKSQLEAARARVTQSRSAYFPQIVPSQQYSSRYTAYDVGQGTQVGRLTQNVTSIGLDQLLYDMGRREQNVARSKDAARAAEYNVEDTRQAVVLNVTTGWYELLRSKDLVRVAESSADRARTTLDATRAYVEAGQSPRKDVLQAQADYDNAEVGVIRARNTVKLAETALKNAMGITTAQPITTADGPLPAPSTAPDTTTVSEYVAQAYANRPDLKSAQAGITASQRDVKIARIEAGPQVQSSVSAGYRVNPDPGNERSILTTISYPLFDAGAARAGVRAAKASVQQARESLELSRQDIAASVESAYLTREEARLRISAAQTALNAAKENYNAASESQKEGVGTILDVITAQNLLVTAETNAVQAVYDYYTADASLKRAVGAMDTTPPTTTATTAKAVSTTHTARTNA